MSCENVQDLISPMLDRELEAGKREQLMAHIQSCRKCGAYFESMESVRTALRGVEQAAVPAELSAKLRVSASHARARQLARATFGKRLQSAYDRAQLVFDNLMRPVALPFAGGLSSAVILFGLLVPTLSFPHNFADRALFTSPDGEVAIEAPGGIYMPEGLAGIPRIVPVNAAVPDDANVVELTVDESGRVIDFSVSHGSLTQDLQNIIMFSKFTPATFLGQPTSGKVKAVQFARALRTIRS